MRELGGGNGGGRGKLEGGNSPDAGVVVSSMGQYSIAVGTQFSAKVCILG